MQAKARTFTESARRAQIVAAAIETIAGLGYARASFAQIAKEAKLSSTGLISYHFANKEELVRTVLEDVFAAAQPTRMRALLNIFLGGALERILRWGQESGEFREFDVRVMATTIRRSVEGPVFLLAGAPETDLTAYAEELVTLFDLAARGGHDCRDPPVGHGAARIVVSVAGYYALRGLGMDVLPALALGALPTVLFLLYPAILLRKIDTLAIFVLIIFAVSVSVSFITGSPRFTLARSKLAKSPWAEPLRAADWNDLWPRHRWFRRAWRVATVLWGAGLLADTAGRSSPSR
ncbi:TetR family transcriptional regulator [Amycolatopsis sp. cmx-11-12]|uniref:TetR family transcriptional regulator n=1 Tax=Amycolatopsis sp. cmx-11-12 TaxID=2785795 RepID=UPI003917EDA1